MGGGDEKQLVRKYENNDVEIFKAAKERAQSEYEKTRAEFVNYYQKIGKLKQNATESEIDNVLSSQNKKELERLSGLIKTNQELQANAENLEKSWNKLDQQIEDVVQEFNVKRNLKGNDRLDPNLVKALMFSETEMGTGTEYLELVKYISGSRPDALFQLNLGRVTDPAMYNQVVSTFGIPINPNTNYKSKGNKNDVMLAAGALFLKFDYAKKVGGTHLSHPSPWFNAVVAYKGASAEGVRKAQLVWNLYKNGTHPYTKGKKLF